MANVSYWHRQVELPPTAGRPLAKPPRPGDVVYVGPGASVQFSPESAITKRVIRVNKRPTYHGWCWLDGYQLDATLRRTSPAIELAPAHHAPFWTALLADHDEWTRFQLAAILDGHDAIDSSPDAVGLLNV